MVVLTAIIVVASLLTQIVAIAASVRLLSLSKRRSRWLPLIATLLLAGRSLVMVWAIATEAVDRSAAGLLLAEVLLFVVSVVAAFLLYIVPARLKMHLDAFAALHQRVDEQATFLQQSASQLDAESARHKAVVAALQTAEMVYSRTLDAQPDRICRYRTDGTVTYANQQYGEALGLPRDALVGHSVFEVVPAVFHAAIHDALRQLNQTTPVLSSEQYVVRVDGEHWEQWTRHAIFDTQGNLIEIQAVGRDITPQRQAERALRESEQRLRQIFEHMPVLIAALGAHGMIVYWGRECERLTGYRAEEMVGNPQAFELIYPDEAYRNEVRQHARDLGGDFREEETTVTCKDGSTRIISWASVSQVLPVSGWHQWIVGVDVTARKQAEAALQRAHDSLGTQVGERTAELQAAQAVLEREIAERHRAEIAVRQSQTQLRTTLDAIDDMVYVVDAKLRITVCNAALLRFARETGLSANPIGMTPFELFPFLHDRMRGEYFHVFETGEMISGEEVFTLGAVQWVNETRKIPICAAEGQVTHVLTVIHDITERTRAAAQLAASEDMTRRLIEQSPFGITLVNAEGMIIEWNAAFAQITGIPRDEAVGQPMWELEQRMVPAEMQGEGWLERQRQITLDFLQGKMEPTAQISYTMQRPDGAHRALRASIFLLRTAQAMMAASFVEDVTEQQAAVQALAASEEKFRRFVEASQDGIHIFDQQGTVIEWNDASVRMTGIPREEALGKAGWDLLLGVMLEEARTPEAAERVRQGIQHMLETGHSPLQHHTYTMLHRDGSLHHVQPVAFAIDTAQGRLAGGISRDRTDQLRADEALQTSEKRLRTLIDTMPDIIIVKDGAGRWLLANEAALRLFGLGGVQYQGRTNGELADQSPFYRMVLLACDDTDAAVWRAGTMITAEETFPQSEGPPRVFDVIKIPLFDADGAHRELMVVGREITARQRAEQHAFQVAVERERGTILSDFIRDTSHEFANPLSVIKTNVYIAQQVDDPARIAMMLDGIRGQTLHIEKLVEGLLAMSRLDQGVQFSHRGVQINDLLRSVVDMVRNAAAQRAHTVSLELIEDLPLIHADTYWLHRALAELLTNAIQHTPEGGTITISAVRTGGQIVVSVHDTGVGISAEYVPHIFERFYRVDKARAARGAGLGLAIAQQVAERHGGHITVDSTPNEGSTFRLYLPIPPA